MAEHCTVMQMLRVRAPSGTPSTTESETPGSRGVVALLPPPRPALALQPKTPILRPPFGTCDNCISGKAQSGTLRAGAARPFESLTMTLRAKTLLVIGITLLGLLALLYVAAN